MGRPIRADDVLKAFHGLDDWLKTEESLFWIKGYMAMSMKQFQERGSEYQWNTVYGDTLDPAKFRGYLAADLWKARLFQVTEEMVDLTSSSWQHSKLDMSGLEENHLPSPYGWAWLDKQFIRRGDDNAEMGTSAISWGLVPSLPGVRMAFYHRTSDVNRTWKASMRDTYLATHGDRHNLLYTHSNVVPFEAKIGIPSFGGDNIINWMKVLWALMDAEVSTDERQRGFTPYNMKRHRERYEGKAPEITVILLRRATPRLPKEDGKSTPHMIDWSLGRVVVQGFHRHISANYAPIPHHHALPNKDDANKSCKTCGNEITWVRGHLRGPEGLPIRNAEQLWRLSR